MLKLTLRSKQYTEIVLESPSNVRFQWVCIAGDKVSKLRFARRNGKRTDAATLISCTLRSKGKRLCGTLRSNNTRYTSYAASTASHHQTTSFEAGSAAVEYATRMKTINYQYMNAARIPSILDTIRQWR